MLAYPATLLPDDAHGGYTVLFRDVPEAITEGDSRSDALSWAVDALDGALSFYIASGEPLPKPSQPIANEVLVAPSALAQAKIALYESMRRQAIGKADLARRLGCHLAQVNRLLDLTHASRMDHVEKALAVVGRRIVVDTVDAA